MLVKLWVRLMFQVHLSPPRGSSSESFWSAVRTSDHPLRHFAQHLKVPIALLLCIFTPLRGAGVYRKGRSPVRTQAQCSVDGNRDSEQS